MGSPAGGGPAAQPGLHLGGRLPRLLDLLDQRVRGGVLARHRDPAAVPVERLVGQPVGVPVLLARHPGVRRAERREPAGLRGQRPHVGVLDLPAAGHLLDDELGVHPDLDLGVRGVARAASRRPAISPEYSATLLLATPIAVPSSAITVAGVGVLEHGAVRRRAGVAARAAVGLDDDRGVPAARSPSVPHRPDSAVRTRIREHSSHRTTRSLGGLLDHRELGEVDGRAGSRCSAAGAARPRRPRAGWRAASRRARAGPRAALGRGLRSRADLRGQLGLDLDAPLVARGARARRAARRRPRSGRSARRGCAGRPRASPSPRAPRPRAR